MTDRFTVRMVVGFIGAAVLVFGVAASYLAWVVLQQAAKAGEVEAAAVAVVQIPFGIATTALGVLGGMLISTRTQPNKDEIDKALAPLTDGQGGIPVVGIGGGPVVTEEVGGGEAGHFEVWWAALLALAFLIGLICGRIGLFT